MQGLLQAIGSWPGAVLLQGSGTAYLLVNACHILGIGLLIGAIVPLDLKLLGLFPRAPLTVLGPFLSRAAALGVGVAIVTGLWLFSVKPVEYAANAAFLCKVSLLALALLNVAVQHRSRLFHQALAGGPVHGRVRALAFISGCLWVGVLVAGRWIGFV